MDDNKLTNLDKEIPIRILDTIDKPDDLRQLSAGRLKELARELREEMVCVTSKNGGHLAPNLGVVELTIALLLALDTPKDKVIWDVGHQSYVYKLLTGRRKQFHTLRTFQGLSGFPRKDESPYDHFNCGHASNSLSVALGLALGYQRQGDERQVVAVIGDGALTGGMAFEALNQAGHHKANLIIILNDNEMSIDGNVGAMSSYLNRLRLDPTYNRMRDDIVQAIRCIPAVGDKVVSLGESVRSSLKQFLVPGMLFEELGFKYIGPVDGHNINAVKQSIKLAGQVGGPIVIHTLTVKGKGYKPAEENPDRFHGTGAFNVETGECLPAKNQAPSYTSVFGETMVRLAKTNKKLVCVTAAMTQGTGLRRFKEKYPDRFYDVGIAEQHAVTFAAGLALAGWQPVVAIYSTFLQRAFDQVIEDVCLQDLPIIFAVDRCGLVGDDGPTHHGIFDLSYLSEVPNMVVMSPKDEDELKNMIFTATKIPHPSAIRYPRGAGLGVSLSEKFIDLPVGKAEVMSIGENICIIALGRMVALGQNVKEALLDKGIDATLVNARYAKPFDGELILKMAAANSLIVTIEENVLTGGFGASVSQLLGECRGAKVLNIGLPDAFIEHGKVERLFAEVGLEPEAIVERILKVVRTEKIKIRSNAG